MSSGSFKNRYLQTICVQIIIYKQDSALNNLRGLICNESIYCCLCLYTSASCYVPLWPNKRQHVIYITIYIYFLDGRLCEVGAIRRGVRIVRLWGLESSVQVDDGRGNAHGATTEQDFVNSGIFQSLPFNSSVLYYHQTTTRRYGHASTPLRFLPIMAIGMCHFHRLWNSMCDRHRAEITVMQFTGRSLPVHHFVTARWDFYLVPYCQPSSPTPMEYALPPSLE